MFPDPILTPENLSTVLDSMEDWLWSVFSLYVNIPSSEIKKIIVQYPSDSQDKQAKLAAIPHLISTHPSLSWRIVADALYRLGDDSSHRALDHLQQKFPTGNTYCKHYQWLPLPASDFPRGGGGVWNFRRACGPADAVCQ